MKGLKNLGRRTGQRFCSKTWDEGFKEFGKENGSKIVLRVLEGEFVKDFVQSLGMKGSKSLGRRTGQRFLFKDLG